MARQVSLASIIGPPGLDGTLETTAPLTEETEHADKSSDPEGQDLSRFEERLHEIDEDFKFLESELGKPGVAVSGTDDEQEESTEQSMEGSKTEDDEEEGQSSSSDEGYETDRNEEEEQEYRDLLEQMQRGASMESEEEEEEEEDAEVDREEPLERSLGVESVRNSRFQRDSLREGEMADESDAEPLSPSSQSYIKYNLSAAMLFGEGSGKEESEEEDMLSLNITADHPSEEDFSFQDAAEVIAKDAEKLEIRQTLPDSFLVEKSMLSRPYCKSLDSSRGSPVTDACVSSILSAVGQPSTGHPGRTSRVGVSHWEASRKVSQDRG